jgi:serine protease Do
VRRDGTYLFDFDEEHIMEDEEHVVERKTLAISLIAAYLIGSTSVGHSAGIGLLFSQSSAMAQPHTEIASSAASASNASALSSFDAIAASYGPAVVNVSVTREVKSAAVTPEMPQPDPNDLSDQLSKRFQIPAPRGEVLIRGIGSGFIVSPDGVILTNAHVVDGAKQVDVKLMDKREFKAKVVGVDKESDVAVLKIGASRLPAVKLGNPAELRVGDWVLAIGSPFGFENTVTQGIVSAKSRTLPDQTYVPFIQTDVPLNPGNSGGPLFNLKGEVIGINAEIYSHSGGYEGLSFAIPVDIAANVERQILEHGEVERGHLGVAIQEITQGLADSFGLKRPDGALVSTVELGGPAAKAGLRPGDVLLKFNGKEIVNATDLPVQAAGIKPGTSVKLEVFREGETKEVDVTLDKLQNTAVAGAETGAPSN